MLSIDATGNCEKINSQRCCSACQESYCDCWFIQLSGDVLKTIDERIAIKILDKILQFMHQIFSGNFQ
jgi:hypothetical protein